MKNRPALARYTVGAALARTGDEAAGPALLLAGLAATGSSARASALLAAGTAAAALGGPVVGALLDRSPRPGRLLAGALAGYAAALVAVLLCLGRTPYPLPLLVAAASGLLAPALSGGWTAQLPHVAGPTALPRATALDAMTFHAAALAGPALVGGVAALYGAPAGVVAAAALIGAVVPLAWTLPPGAGAPLSGTSRDRDLVPVPHGGGVPVPHGDGVPVPHRDGAPQGVPGRPARGVAGVAVGVAEGARALVRSRVLARVTAASVLSCAGQGVLVACAPLLGARYLGGPGQGALLLAGAAGAALAADAVLARTRRPPGPEAVFRGATLVQAAALPVLAAGVVGVAGAAGGHPAVVVGAVLLVGAGEGPQLTALLALRHRESPDGLRGQIQTTGASLKITGFACGAAVAGPLASVSPPGALLAAAAAHAVAVAVSPRGAGARTGRRTARRPPRAPAARTPGTPGPAGRPAHRPSAPRPPRDRSSCRGDGGAR
ncbi:hypothetical protein ATE80_16110 [Streptomyces kanasensis]|uniref:MFS transporter n=1 Tax=Streptomyces kanasensis TaxID=936756 RepID=A0A100Y506_9ACTN|nr:hypothetical protein ATE80_16110 [Streptomyces kanasensis]